MKGIRGTLKERQWKIKYEVQLLIRCTISFLYNIALTRTSTLTCMDGNIMCPNNAIKSKTNQHFKVSSLASNFKNTSHNNNLSPSGKVSKYPLSCRIITRKIPFMKCIYFNDRNDYSPIGVSSSGAMHKHPGRVGDSPLPGSGLYAGNHIFAYIFVTFVPFEFFLFRPNQVSDFENSRKCLLEWCSML